jgi:predicted 3-demethylubiquinone-9 3-methyltransferase (glyoxalase superfamily)
VSRGRRIDELWDKLGPGGEHGPCGWLKNNHGLSWQIVPSGAEEMFNDPDKEGSKRAFAA